MKLMRQNQYILILLFGSFLFSCGESEEELQKKEKEAVEQEILSKLSVTLNEAWSTPLIIENPYLEFPSKASYGKLKFDGVNLKLNKQYAYYKNNDMYMLQRADWVTEVGGLDDVRFTKKQNIPQIKAKWKSEDGLNNGSFLIKPILEGDFVNHFYYELSSDKWMVYGYEKEMSFEEFNEVVISLNSICGTNSVPKDGSSVLIDNGLSDGALVMITAEGDNAMEMHFKKLEEIPVELAFKGELVDAWWWNDLNGENYFLRTLEEEESETMDEEYGTGEMAFYTRNLHAYHYVLTEEKSELILLRELLDFEKECEFDLKVEHIPSVSFNDADQDNYGEITFGYMLACRSDVSPSTFKVFTFENGDKYGLRGSSETMGYGGDYDVGDEFNSVPDSLLSNAISYWEENKVEFE